MEVWIVLGQTYKRYSLIVNPRHGFDTAKKYKFFYLFCLEHLGLFLFFDFSGVVLEIDLLHFKTLLAEVHTETEICHP